MHTIFMNSEISETSHPHRTQVFSKINLKRKVYGFIKLSIHSTWKNIKKLYENNIFKISVPTWNEEF